MLLTLKLELSLYLAALGFVIYTDTVWLEPLLDGLGTEGPSSACQENVYAKRRKLLEEMCKKYQVEDSARQNPLRGPRLWNVQTPGLNFSYCHIPKTGSNIWRKRIRAILSGIDVNYDESKDEDQVEEGPTQLDEVGRKRPKWMRQLDFPVEWNMQERLDAFLKSFSFLFVRHPFTRLVSEYRYLSTENQRESGHRFRVLNGTKFSNTGAELPTFNEYISLIVSGALPASNSVFQDRYWSICWPCQLRYRLIAKVETSGQDTRCILHHLGLDATASVAEEMTEGDGNRSNLHLFRVDEKLHQTGGESSEKAAKELFKTLSKKQVRQLFELFKLDFILFGYSATEYENLAKGK